MISLCVFSKNRPMQLEAFLDSLTTNAQYIKEEDIYVLYTYTNDQFKQGYDILKSSFKNINWILESDLKTQLIDLVKGFKQYFLWTTDDSLFYRYADLTPEKIDWAFNKRGAMAINLRMGLNIKWQNHWFGETSVPIVVDEEFEDLIVYDASKYNVNTDVGRVWQNDASIMPRDLYLAEMLKDDSWKRGIGVRELDNLAQSGRKFNPCKMVIFKESVYLNVPVNLVHLLNDGRLYADNWGKHRQYSTDELNKQFLEGKKIHWQIADFSNLDCGRREIEYTFMDR